MLEVVLTCFEARNLNFPTLYAGGSGGAAAPPAHDQGGPRQGRARGGKICEKSKIFKFSKKLYLGWGCVVTQVRGRVNVF